MRARGLLIVLLLTLPTAAWSVSGKMPLSGVMLQSEAFRPVAIGNLPTEADALEYRDDEQPHAYVQDLNGDGVPDYLIAAHPDLCGTGGCPYLLVDGKSGQVIGDFFGTIALLDLKINGYPVIQSVSKQNIAAITVLTHVFDGSCYRLTASSLLEEHGIAAWIESLGQEKKP
jgi:hypothetical protein